MQSRSTRKDVNEKYQLGHRGNGSLCLSLPRLKVDPPPPPPQPALPLPLTKMAAQEGCFVVV